MLINLKKTQYFLELSLTQYLPKVWRYIGTAFWEMCMDPWTRRKQSEFFLLKSDMFFLCGASKEK